MTELIKASKELLIAAAEIPVDFTIEWAKESCEKVIRASERVRSAIKIIENK